MIGDMSAKKSSFLTPSFREGEKKIVADMSVNRGREEFKSATK